jgi:hypothetical protein
MFFPRLERVAFRLININTCPNEKVRDVGRFLRGITDRLWETSQ